MRLISTRRRFEQQLNVNFHVSEILLASFGDLFYLADRDEGGGRARTVELREQMG